MSARHEFKTGRFYNGPQWIAWYREENGDVLFRDDSRHIRGRIARRHFEQDYPGGETEYNYSDREVLACYDACAYDWASERELNQKGRRDEREF